jgi:Big-like domain-containing protein
MPTMHFPRALAAVAVVVVAAACADSFSPSPRPGGSSMTLVPRATSLGTGEAVVLSAQVFDELGEPMVGIQYIWSSSNESVATVSSSGTVYGLAEGRASITARAHGQAQTSSVRVLRREGGMPPKPKPGPNL